jgi:RNA polymerase sigma factor (sigma-70 family)
VLLLAVDDPLPELPTVTADFSGLKRFLRLRLAMVGSPFSAPVSSDVPKTRARRFSSVISLASADARESGSLVSGYRTDVAVRSDAAGPADADVELLLEYRSFVLRLCRILLRGDDGAEDAAQQVFVNAYHAIGDGVRPADMRAWLAQIARNECRSHMRRAAGRNETSLPETLPAPELDPADVAAEHALVARLRRELANLPARQREAVLLREFRGLSYGELAAVMDETGPAVESLLHRARRRLASRLEDARRPFVGAALALDWVRNAVARIVPGPAATEAVTAGGTAAVVAKLAAAGVVAVGVGAATADPRPTVGHRPVPRVVPHRVSRSPGRMPAPSHTASIAVVRRQALPVRREQEKRGRVAEQGIRGDDATTAVPRSDGDSDGSGGPGSSNSGESSPSAPATPTTEASSGEGPSSGTSGSNMESVSSGSGSSDQSGSGDFGSSGSGSTETSGHGGSDPASSGSGSSGSSGSDD